MLGNQNSILRAIHHLTASNPSRKARYLNIPNVSFHCKKRWVDQISSSLVGQMARAMLPAFFRWAAFCGIPLSQRFLLHDAHAQDDEPAQHAANQVCPGEVAQFTVQLGACRIAETRRGIRTSQEECRGSSTKFGVWRALLIWSGKATVRIARLQSPWILYRIKERKLLSDAWETVLEVVVEIEENMTFPLLQGQSL